MKFRLFFCEFFFLIINLSLISVDGSSPLIVHHVKNGEKGDVEGIYDLRDSKKIVFFDNKAYDLTDNDHRTLWNMYMKKAYVPEDSEIKLDEKLIITNPVLKKRVSDFQNDRTNSDPQIPINSDNQKVKMSRFVADPEKVHLIETVDIQELETPQTTTTTEHISVYNQKQSNIATTQAPEKQETSTVFYEQSQSSTMEFIVNELVYNLGSLFTRELFTDVTSVISYIWNSLVYTLQSTGRRLLETDKF